jgi:hypothetical protein
MTARRASAFVTLFMLTAAGAASAASFELTSVPFGPTLTPGDTGLIPTTSSPSGGSPFTNDWFFTLGSQSSVGGDVASIDLTVAPGLNTQITGLSASLVDTDTSTTVASGSESFDVAALVSGHYELVITGTPTGTLGGIYAGAVAVSAVPLPAAAWLLLSGLAGVGAMARRRRLESVV